MEFSDLNIMDVTIKDIINLSTSVNERLSPLRNGVGEEMEIEWLDTDLVKVTFLNIVKTLRIEDNLPNSIIVCEFTFTMKMLEKVKDEQDFRYRLHSFMDQRCRSGSWGLVYIHNAAQRAIKNHMF